MKDITMEIRKCFKLSSKTKENLKLCKRQQKWIGCASLSISILQISMGCSVYTSVLILVCNTCICAHVCVREREGCGYTRDYDSLNITLSSGIQMKKWLNFPNIFGNTSYSGLTNRQNIIFQPGTILQISTITLTYTIFSLCAEFRIYVYVIFKQVSVQSIFKILYEVFKSAVFRNGSII